MSTIDYQAVVEGAPLPTEDLATMIRYSGAQPVGLFLCYDGWQFLWRFDNGWGASVVQHSAVQGWDVCPIVWTGEGVDDWEHRLCRAFHSGDTAHGCSAVEVVGELRQISEFGRAAVA